MKIKTVLLLSCFMLAASLYAKPASKKAANTEPAPKPKLTVCSITINSEEEINAFKSYLPGKDFNFVELTNKEDPMWFSTACKSGVKCDILVISGHFGGTFFGASGLRLSASELEEHSCNNECAGILDNPIEVFMFGCNTLAGKEEDIRTPEQYLNVLMADGIPREEAELRVTARYLQFERSFKTQAKISFSQVPHIYGFCSVAPSGANVKSTLSSYLSDKAGYANWVRQEQKKRTELVSQNKQLINKMRVINQSFQECSGILCKTYTNEDNVKYENLKKDICFFYVDKTTVLAKLTYIKQLFEKGRDAYSSLFSTIMDFFYKINFSVSSAEEKQIYADIQNMQKVGIELNKDLLLLDVTPLFKLKMVCFMNQMTWLSDNEAAGIYKKSIKDNLNGPVSWEFLGLVNSLPETARKAIGKSIKMEDFDEKNFPYLFSYHGLLLLKAILPEDPKIQRRLISLIYEKLGFSEADIAESILLATKTQDPQVQLALVQLLSSQAPYRSNTAARILEELKPSDLQVLVKIVECLKSKDGDVRRNAGELLVDIKPKDPLVLSKITECLDYDGDTRDRALLFFMNVQAQDPKIVSKIAEYLKSPDPKVRIYVLRALGKTGTQDKKIQLMMIDCLKDTDNPDVQLVAIYALGDLKVQDPQVHLMIAGFLQDQDLARPALYALGDVNTQDPKIQLMMVECFKMYELEYTTFSNLKKLKLKDKDVIKAIEAISNDETLSDDARTYARQLLGDVAEGK